MRAIPARSVVSFLVPVLAVAPVVAAGQGASEPDPEGIPALLARADELHGLLRPADALDVLRTVLEAEPRRHGALWRAAREAVSLGMLAMDEESRRARYREAEGYAHTAAEVEPGRVEGHAWLAVALGRQALGEGPRTRVRLGNAVRDQALAALAVDSLNAAAHHVLGQWHAEVRRLPGVSRFLAGRLFGAQALDEASWEEAEDHLRRATELDPGGLVHHLELARVYVETGRADLARGALREVLERPTREPVDPLLKQQAQDLLKGLL